MAPATAKSAVPPAPEHKHTAPARPPAPRSAPTDRATVQVPAAAQGSFSIRSPEPREPEPAEPANAPSTAATRKARARA